MKGYSTFISVTDNDGAHEYDYNNMFDEYIVGKEYGNRDLIYQRIPDLIEDFGITDGLVICELDATPSEQVNQRDRFYEASEFKIVRVVPWDEVIAESQSVKTYPIYDESGRSIHAASLKHIEELIIHLTLSQDIPAWIYDMQSVRHIIIIKPANVLTNLDFSSLKNLERVYIASNINDGMDIKIR